MNFMEGMMKGVPFLLKMVHKRVTVWSSGWSLLSEALLSPSPPFFRFICDTRPAYCKDQRSLLKASRVVIDEKR